MVSKRKKNPRVLAPILFAVFLYSLNCSGRVISHEILNLRAFAKLYGYIRFFHPSDESSQLDWNRFAIYGASRVKDAETSAVLKKILEDLFLPVAPTLQIYHSFDTPKAFEPEKMNDVNDIHLVAWQHRGIGLQSQFDVYKSVRLGRYKIPEKVQDGIWLDLRDISSEGQKFKLTAQVKADVEGEHSGGYLFIMAIDTSGVIFLEDYMRDRPIVQNNWEEYSLTGELQKNAMYLTLGAELVGTGRMWVDDFHLFLSDDEEKWVEVTLSNPSFDKIGSTNDPVDWTEMNKGNYGFEVVRVEDNYVLKIESMKGYNPERLFERSPKSGEVINKEIGRELFCQVPLTLWSNSKGTLGNNNDYAYEVLVDQIEKAPIERLTAKDESLRLGNVINAWNVLQHFYPYFDVIDTDWNEVLTIALSEALQNKNESEFELTLKKMVAQLHDGHGFVYSGDDKEEAYFPFRIDWIENQPVITQSTDTTQFKKGDILLKIDGENAVQYFNKCREYESGSPQLKKSVVMDRFQKGLRNSSVQLTVRRGNEIFETSARRNKNTFLFDYMGPKIKKMGSNIVYICLDRTPWKEINKQLDEIATAKGVIFDLRRYPSGAIHELLGHLTGKPLKSARWNIPYIIYPDQENIVGFDTSGRWIIQPEKPRIQGSVVFLTKGRAISYAESILGIIEHYNLGEIVGEPTAGANGNVNLINLPGKYRIRWTGLKVLKHDYSQHHLVGIKPTVRVERTIKGVAEGRDELIEKAIDLINR